VRRADRLFRLVQALRRRRVSTAAQLARALGVSQRTIYRDVQDLSSSGVPIVGEAGVGYAIAKGYDCPPLMFTKEQVEALVLGARIAKAWGDAEIAKAADEALAKVEAVLPEALRNAVPDASLFAPDFHVREEIARHLGACRLAVRERRRLVLAYADRAGASSRRTVLPLGLFFWGNAWSLGAWCELRVGFRNFRLDRMSECMVTNERFVPERGKTLADFFEQYESEDGARSA
jgi:predicted DNA-binding transcriptional regulator YafY